jgi:hypothetical protein
LGLDVAQLPLWEVDFSAVNTFSANSRHGERNEEAQGGAEEELF